MISESPPTEGGFPLGPMALSMASVSQPYFSPSLLWVLPILVMHEQIPLVFPVFSMKHH